MPEILKLILNSLLFFCLVACNEGSDMVLLLNKAEMYMSEKPDSALSLLDSILQPDVYKRQDYKGVNDRFYNSIPDIEFIEIKLQPVFERGRRHT